MKSSAKKVELAPYDDLFSTEESRQDAKLEKVREIPLSELHPFKNHPFKVKDDEAMMETADSVRQYGVLVPAIARPDPEGGYELVAGHRRHRASELAEKETMPVIVRDLDDDAATIIMVDSNLQRESLLPSERAFAYKMKLEATINFKKSMHYNPFAYIHSEKDILKLVTTLIANTKGEGKAGDDFWVKAETLLYCALIGYIHYEAPVEEQNFSTLIEFINAMEVREDDEEFKNPVDLMFDALEAEKPNHFAVRQYKKYKLAAGKTAKSILISCGARLAVFDIAELREVTSYDELELDTLGDRRTALFLIMSDTDDSFNFLISMCYHRSSDPCYRSGRWSRHLGCHQPPRRLRQRQPRRECSCTVKYHKKIMSN